MHDIENKDIIKAIEKYKQNKKFGSDLIDSMPDNLWPIRTTIDKGAVICKSALMYTIDTVSRKANKEIINLREYEPVLNLAMNIYYDHTGLFYSMLEDKVHATSAKREQNHSTLYFTWDLFETSFDSYIFANNMTASINSKNIIFKLSEHSTNLLKDNLPDVKQNIDGKITEALESTMYMSMFLTMSRLREEIIDSRRI